MRGAVTVVLVLVLVVERRLRCSWFLLSCTAVAAPGDGGADDSGVPDSRDKLLARLGRPPPDASVAAFKIEVLTARGVGPLVTGNCCSLTLNAEKNYWKLLYLVYSEKLIYAQSEGYLLV